MASPLLIISATALLPKSGTFEVPGVRMSMYLFGWGHNATHNIGFAYKMD